MTYIAASTLDDALTALADGPVSIIAGGTDWFPAQGDRPFHGTLLDLTRIEGLRGITRTPQGWRIGATTTWTDVLRADLPGAFDGLKQAAAEVGSIQIQNAGTVAGNLCNASPAADGVPPLLTLNAKVELTSQSGSRHMALSKFLKGVRKTDRREGELLTALHIPTAPTAAQGAFLKLGARKYLVISICMVAVLVEMQDDTIVEARIAVGAASPVAQRLPELEAAVQGATRDTLTERITPDLLHHLSPITDMRGSADYRRDAVVEAVRRALLMAMKVL